LWSLSRGSIIRLLLQVVISTVCRLSLGLHLLSRSVDILPLLQSPKGLLQAPDDFSRAFALYRDTDQGADEQARVVDAGSLQAKRDTLFDHLRCLGVRKDAARQPDSTESQTPRTDARNQHRLPCGDMG
jgi:hypothetical protein